MRNRMNETSDCWRYAIVAVASWSVLNGPASARADESVAGVPADAEALAEQPRPAIELGTPFGDNAVLQQGIPIPVWGTARAGATITVTLGSQTKTAVSDATGAWRVALDPLPADRLTSVYEAPAGRTLTVTALLDAEEKRLTITNLLVGEVWLCAGQSNMAGKLGKSAARLFPEDSVAKAGYPALRQMVYPDARPWSVCVAESASDFKKLSFLFARRVQRDILLPIGIVNTAVGGSNIESWLNQAPFAQGMHFTQKILPLAGYGLRGVLWYQGESNEKDQRAYLPKLRSLILGWREIWSQPDAPTADGPRGDFPFYVVQLPGIGASLPDNPAGGDGRAEIRQAQFEALALPNTGLAVTIDVGAVQEHPPNKVDIGERLARLALHNVYGFKELVPSGPLYKGCTVEGDRIRVTFENAQNGLMLARKDGVAPPMPTPGVPMPWLSIQAKDGTWHWAEGVIDGSELLVSCKDVKEPVAVRYAYTQHPVGCNLYNTDGIPASPFSSCGY